MTTLGKKPCFAVCSSAQPSHPTNFPFIPLIRFKKKEKRKDSPHWSRVPETLLHESRNRQSYGIV